MAVQEHKNGTVTITADTRPRFARYIRKLRKQKNLSGRTAAKLIGISSAYMSHLETGKKSTTPSLRILMAMAHVYGVPFEMMLAETTEGTGTGTGTMLLTEYKYIRFQKIKMPTSRKTAIYSCLSNSDNTVLGTVKWFSRWRQFCFFPEPQTIFNRSCTADIIDFIDQLMVGRQ